MSAYDLKHIDVTNEIYNQIYRKVSKSFPLCDILEILELDNKKLKERFDIYGKDYKLLELFHGTSQENIDKISTHGFDYTKNIVNLHPEIKISTTKVTGSQYLFKELKSIKN